LDAGASSLPEGVGMKSAAIISAGLAVMMLAASCSEPITDLQPSIAVIYGSVTDLRDAPVDGAFVQVYIYPLDRDCTTEDGWLAGTRVTRDGRYGIMGTFLHVAREQVCVSVRVRPPEGSGLGEARVDGDTVTFIHESATPPVDSVRVDVQLPDTP
jgi:hypothetical protein